MKHIAPKLSAALSLAVVMPCFACGGSSPTTVQNTFVTKGAYFFGWADLQRESTIAGRLSGKSMAFRVRYQGPKPWIEIVCETWRGSELARTDLVYREEYGATHWVENAEEGTTIENVAPFTHSGQFYAMSVQVLPQEQTARVKLNIYAEGDADRWRGHSEDVALMDYDSYSHGVETIPMRSGADTTLNARADTEEVTLAMMAKHGEGASVSTSAPYPENSVVWVFKLRFRES